VTAKAVLTKDLRENWARRIGHIVSDSEGTLIFHVVPIDLGGDYALSSCPSRQSPKAAEGCRRGCRGARVRNLERGLSSERPIQGLILMPVTCSLPTYKFEHSVTSTGRDRPARQHHG